MDFIEPDYKSKDAEKKTYLDDLKNIIVQSNASLEGNCFYHHETLKLYPALYSKQLNLFWCGKQAGSRICEIGFNAGHSTMLLLLGRDKTPLRFTIFDIGEHSYTKPCVEYIRSKFSHVDFEYIEGDSTRVMPEWIDRNPDIVGSYDVVHVDGGHSEHCISNDMKHTDILVKKHGIVIIDDTNDPTINKYVDLYISTGNYIELQLLPSYGYQHRILRKIQ